MKNVRLRLLVASALTLFVAACSQVPTPQAQSETLTPQFGTRNEDTGSSVFASKRNDAVYVTGIVSRTIDDGSVTRDNTDAFLRRYLPNGTLGWEKTFNATTYEVLKDLAEDSRGNIIVALAKNSGDSDGTSELFKYKATGQEIWHRSLAGIRVVFNIATTPNGGFYVIGDDSNFRTLIRRYDQNGTLLWAKRLAENEFFGPSATDAQGNLYTMGVNSKIYKFDQTGKIVWTRLVPKGTADGIDVRNMVVDKDALLLLGLKTWVLGNTEYEFESETDIAVFKYNLDGKKLWSTSFGTKESDSDVSIDVDNKHNIYIAAYVGGLKSLVLREYTPAGRTLRQTTIAENLSSANDSVNDMVVRQAGEFYFTGQTGHDLGAGYKGGYFDAFLMRLDSKGRQVWVR